jgi:hypothetical protein
VELPLVLAFGKETPNSLGLIWSGLLMHQTNCWRHFGHRYLIDLLPTGFVIVLYAYRRFTRGIWRPSCGPWS